jgi:peptide/nickel transport system substrate-binding protein
VAASVGTAAVLFAVLSLVVARDETPATTNTVAASTTASPPATTVLTVVDATSTSGPTTTETTTTAATAPATAATAPATAPASSGGGHVAMRVTIDIDPDAVWDDGSPISANDFRCTWLANANTSGSINIAGYDRIAAVRAGADRKQVVVTFSEPYAAYRELFDGLIKADAVEDCKDVSAELQTDVSFSGGPYRIESWSPERAVLVANPRFWGSPPEVERVVIAAIPDPAAEFPAIERGEVDFVSPPLVGVVEEQFVDPSIEIVRSYGGDFEALYFQQLSGPFADPVFREAFSKSIDLDAFYEVIYAPLADGRPRLTCGPVVSRRFCPSGAFEDTFDPEGAAAALTEAGWARDADGFWAKDGVIPEIRWMVSSGNARREASQAYLIPVLAQAGFRVVADNCVAECVFEQRLPALDYDLTTYASVALPDPGYLTVAFSCINVPSIENDFRGQNQQGWCNTEASSLLEQADVTLDVDERAAIVHEAIRLMSADHVLLPLFELPQISAIRTDRLSGVIEDDELGYGAFEDFSNWSDADGNGEIVIGAEQLPVCLNPVTECAASPWYRRAVAVPLLPSVWEVTSDGSYSTTELVVGEPAVVLADEQ